MSRKLLVLTLLMLAALLVAWVTVAQAKNVALSLPANLDDPPLPEDAVTRISCTYIGKTYHYDLYIPSGYYAAADTRYPVIFITSPGGNATMDNSEGWIRSQHWLAVMLVEAQNGPSEPNDENFLCAHDDVIQRVRVHDNMKFATGVSGAARMSARFATYRPGFRGLILQAAGMCTNYGFCDSIEWFLSNKPNIYTFATFGDTDFNLWELDYMREYLPAARFNSEVFAGGHQPAPVDTMNRAFGWLTAQIIEQEYAIIGRLMVRDSVSNPKLLLSGVTFSAGPGSSITIDNPIWIWRNTTTGHYYIKYSISVMGPGAYTLTAHKAGYLFTPASRVVSAPPEVWDQDFEMRLGFDISGRVLDANGTPWPAVQVSAGSGRTTTTGTDGGYTLSALPAGIYSLVPALSGYAFQPPMRIVTLPPDAVGQNFVILAAPTSITLPAPGASSPSFSLTYADTQGLPTTIEFPAGAIPVTAATVPDSAATGSITAVVTPTLAPGGAGLAFTGHAFDLAVYRDGHPQSGLTFSKPVTVTIHYSAADIRAVNDESQLVLGWWTGNGWENVTDTCTPPSIYHRDLSNQVIRVPICRSGLLSLSGPTHQTYLPLVHRG